MSSYKALGHKLNNGFTLVEIILSIAILGIIAVAFLPIFTTGIKGIANSGSRSKSSYQAQDAIELKQSIGASSTSAPLTIVFPNPNPSEASINVQMNGEIVTNGSMNSFVPK